MQLPPHISETTDASYCIGCLSNQVFRVFHNELMKYHCRSCGSVYDRRISISNDIKWWLSSERTLWHESVGILLVNPQDELLCLKRTLYPFTLALPAGHLSREEDPLSGVIRELKEETGLEASNISLVGVFPIIGDSCPRGSDHHLWNLYRGNVPNLEPLVLNDESSNYHWLSRKELIDRNDVSFALQHIISEVL